MQGILDFFADNSSLLIFIATITLAIITYFYLRETKKERGLRSNLISQIFRRRYF
jgi:hypothetical protein